MTDGVVENVANTVSYNSGTTNIMNHKHISYLILIEHVFSALMQTADVIFVIDASASIKASNFVKMQNFALKKYELSGLLLIVMNSSSS
jgi:ABC-type branched-subunit amino acid transport system ATPase component